MRFVQVVLISRSARLQSDAKARRDKNLSTLVMRLCVVGDPAQIAACIERSESVLVSRQAN